VFGAPDIGRIVPGLSGLTEELGLRGRAPVFVVAHAPLSGVERLEADERICGEPFIGVPVRVEREA
jgi:hypothetical protein